MTPRRALTAALLLLITVLVWWRTKPPAAGTSSGSLPAASLSPGSGVSLSVTQSSPPPERSNLADELNAPARDIRADLRLVSSIVETFRSNFLQTGNPV